MFSRPGCCAWAQCVFWLGLIFVQYPIPGRVQRKETAKHFIPRQLRIKWTSFAWNTTKFDGANRCATHQIRSATNQNVEHNNHRCSVEWGTNKIGLGGNGDVICRQGEEVNTVYIVVWRCKTEKQSHSCVMDIFIWWILFDVWLGGTPTHEMPRPQCVKDLHHAKLHIVQKFLNF